MTSIKQSTPVMETKKAEAANASFSSGYLPSGILISMILKALRDAQDSDIKRQQDQAEAEQDFYKALGNLGGDPSKGIIAMAAAATEKAGDEQAKGLMASGRANLVGGVLAGGALVYTTGYGAYESGKSSGVTNEIKDLEQEKESLGGKRDADLLIGKNAQEAPEEGAKLQDEMDALRRGKEAGPEAEAALKVDNQEALEEAKTAKDKQIKQKEKERETLETSITRRTNNGGAFSQAAATMSQGIGSFYQAPHTVKQAQASATADVDKNLQQTNSGSAANLRQDADGSRQQALRTADDLAQVAASQVQIRG